jgi:hypothetical protein
MKEVKMSKTKNVPEPNRLDDPDMRGSEKAMHRAALR